MTTKQDFLNYVREQANVLRSTFRAKFAAMSSWSRPLALLIFTIAFIPILVGFLKDTNYWSYRNQSYDSPEPPWDLYAYLIVRIIEEPDPPLPFVDTKRFSVKVGQLNYKPYIDEEGKIYCLRGLYLTDGFVGFGEAYYIDDELGPVTPLLSFEGKCENLPISVMLGYGEEPLAPELLEEFGIEPGPYLTYNVGGIEEDQQLPTPEIEAKGTGYTEFQVLDDSMYPEDRGTLETSIFAVVEASDGTQKRLAPELTVNFRSHGRWVHNIVLSYSSAETQDPFGLTLIKGNFHRPLTVRLFTHCVLGIMLILIISLLFAKDGATVTEISIGILLGLWSIKSFLIPEYILDMQAIAHYAIPYLYLLFSLAVFTRLILMPLFERVERSRSLSSK